MNENKYRTLTEKLSVPEELNDRVVQAVRRQERLEREETGHGPHPAAPGSDQTERFAGRYGR